MIKSEEVEFYDIHNKTILIPKNKIEFRPSAYGIVISGTKVLLAKTKTTKKYSLPGGAVELGEKLEESLKREILEECGIEVDVKKFINFEERGFYYEPLDKAWQMYAFLFLCEPLSLEISQNLKSESEEDENPQWVEIINLKKGDFQVFEDKVFVFLQTLV